MSSVALSARHSGCVTPSAGPVIQCCGVECQPEYDAARYHLGVVLGRRRLDRRRKRGDGKMTALDHDLFGVAGQRLGRRRIEAVSIGRVWISSPASL